jgi:hypothetical protein
MTIQVPEPGLSDKILQLFGKRRAVKIPVDIYKKYGPYVYAHAVRESFWRALLRPKGKNLPEGYFYAENFHELTNHLKRDLFSAVRLMNQQEPITNCYRIKYRRFSL